MVAYEVIKLKYCCSSEIVLEQSLDLTDKSDVTGELCFAGRFLLRKGWY